MEVTNESQIIVNTCTFLWIHMHLHKNGFGELYLDIGLRIVLDLTFLINISYSMYFLNQPSIRARACSAVLTANGSVLLYLQAKPCATPGKILPK